jgi:hypothetical protein
MRTIHVVVAGAMLVSAAASARAQTAAAPMSSLEISVACAPPASLTVPNATVPHVLGSQDTVQRGLYHEHDLLVIDSGLGSGLQLGQRFFVRRQNTFGTAYGEHALTARTLGWIRIVAINQTTAIGAVEHVCDGIMARDYLEPFLAPSVPANAESTESVGEPDFSALARVLSGPEDRRAVAPGDMVVIDAGSDRGVVPGTRMAVYRDVRTIGMPLAVVGDAVVVSVGPTIAVARITRARDAVQMGDYLVLRK